MKLLSTSFAIGAIAFLTPAQAEERIWTSSEGQKLSAELVSYDIEAETLTIKNTRGEFTLPFAKISQEDQTFLKNLAEKQREAREALAKQAAEKAGKTIKEETAAGNSFHVYYPKSYTVTQKPPLLILFSPGGGGSGIMKNFQQGADTLGWVLIGCDKLKNGMPDKESNAIFQDILTAIDERVDFDHNLMYMGGLSGGAARAFINTAVFDRPWKGVISCGGWLGGSKNYGLDFRKKMAVAMVNGDADSNANSFIEADGNVLKKRGCKVTVITFPGGHTVGPPDIIESAMKWTSENTVK